MEFPYIRDMILEICANSFESARNAQLGGAHRIELCSELGLGGITPSHGLIKKVANELDIPLYVLIRPRSGDFTYTETEFDVMLQDIHFAKEIGVKGIVSGVLLPDNTIDVEQTGRLLKASEGLDFTFHRAFDWTPDPIQALHTLHALGVKRVLSSGQSTSAMKGLELLKQLKDINNDFIIMPGGGIHSANALRFKEAGFLEIHGSASRFRESVKGNIPMFSTATLENDQLTFSDVDQITNIVKRIQD